MAVPGPLFTTVIVSVRVPPRASCDELSWSSTARSAVGVPGVGIGAVVSPLSVDGVGSNWDALILASLVEPDSASPPGSTRTTSTSADPPASRREITHVTSFALTVHEP